MAQNYVDLSGYYLFAFRNEYIVPHLIMVFFPISFPSCLDILIHCSMNLVLFIKFCTYCQMILLLCLHLVFCIWPSKLFPIHVSMQNIHPDAHEYLSSGCFCVQRSSHGFSRSPVDQTIEQTLNRDTKTRGGIVGFS